MPEPTPDLTRQLAELARALDELAPRVPVGAPVPARGRRPTAFVRRVALVAAVALALVAGVLVLAARPDDDDRTIVSPGPGSTATTTDRAADASDLDWGNLPRTGLAVEGPDGTAAIYDLDGDLLGTTPAPGSGSDLRPEGVLRIGAGLEADDGSAVEVPEGCSSARVGGGVRVALCGGSGPTEAIRIDLVDSAGEHNVLVDGSLQPDGGLGYWRWAIPSPDGAWVLAQWSGECEVPYAWLISTATGVSRPVGGTNPDPPSGPATEGLAWTPDGRMIVRFRSGGCGPEVAQPGTYLVETSALQRSLLLAERDPADLVYGWRGRGYGNALEALIDRVGDSLDLEPCCGEPSHGGSEVSTGWVFEGAAIPVVGFPTGDQPPVSDLGKLQQEVAFAHGSAAVFVPERGGSEARTTVVFVCGPATWRIGWHAVGRPEVDSMLLLGEALLPHLGCTLRDPPRA